MKIIATAFVILSLGAAVAMPAIAFDAKSFFDQSDRESGGTSQ